MLHLAVANKHVSVEMLEWLTSKGCDWSLLAQGDSDVLMSYVKSHDQYNYSILAYLFTKCDLKHVSNYGDSAMLLMLQSADRKFRIEYL